MTRRIRFLTSVHLVECFELQSVRDRPSEGLPTTRTIQYLKSKFGYLRRTLNVYDRSCCLIMNRESFTNASYDQMLLGYHYISRYMDLNMRIYYDYGVSVLSLRHYYNNTTLGYGHYCITDLRRVHILEQQQLVINKSFVYIIDNRFITPNR